MALTKFAQALPNHPGDCKLFEIQHIGVSSNGTPIYRVLNPTTRKKCGVFIHSNPFTLLLQDEEQ